MLTRNSYPEFSGVFIIVCRFKRGVPIIIGVVLKIAAFPETLDVELDTFVGNRIAFRVEHVNVERMSHSEYHQRNIIQHLGRAQAFGSAIKRITAGVKAAVDRPC
jgi:hypothetical protein